LKAAAPRRSDVSEGDQGLIEARDSRLPLRFALVDKRVDALANLGGLPGIGESGCRVLEVSWASCVLTNWINCLALATAPGAL